MLRSGTLPAEEDDTNRKNKGLSRSTGLPSAYVVIVGFYFQKDVLKDLVF